MSSPRTEELTPGFPADLVGTPRARDVIAGRYELREEIGRGGHGVVFAAYDRVLAREVALKFQRIGHASSSALRRFRREAALARDVHHRNLVRVFDLGQVGELEYLIMELVDGPTLSEHVEKEGRLPIDEVRDIAEQLLEALLVLHEADIVHRDVKPSNVLIAADSTRPTVKLGDLGLARRVSAAETRATLDRHLVGTLAYLSPEVVMGGEATARSDLFALGITLLDALFGIKDADSAEIISRLLSRQRKAPRARSLRADRPEMPRWFAEWLTRLLEPDPARRFASARDALAALRGRRSPVAGRRRLRTASALLGAALVGTLAFQMAEPARPRFHGLRASPGGGIEAFDTDGGRLWGRSDLPYEAVPMQSVRLAHLRIDGRVRAALMLPPSAWPRQVSPDGPPMLYLLDPESGNELRRVALELRLDQYSTFGRFAPSYTVDLVALDLDDDGSDEILAIFRHFPSWPSIAVLYEPRIDRSRKVFEAGGHQTLLAATDLDGDGRKDLLFAGYSSVLRRARTITAVKLVPPIDSTAPVNPALTNAVAMELDGKAGAGFLWQRIVDPKGADRVDINAEARQLTLYSRDVALDRLRFDGGPTSEQPTRPWWGSDLQEAFAHLREVLRLSRLGSWKRAAREASNAVPLALAGGDPRLGVVAERFEAIAEIRSGAIDLGIERIRKLMAASSEASAIAFDAAEALHLAGRLDLAVEWYHRVIQEGGDGKIGKQMEDVLRYLVFALIELRHFAEAERAIREFQAAYDWSDDRRSVQLLRSYVASERFKAGEVPGPPLENQLPVGYTHPESVYLGLEVSRAAGSPAPELLKQVDDYLPVLVEGKGTWLAFRAELLRELGRQDEARADAEEAARRLDPRGDVFDYMFRSRSAERIAAAMAASSLNSAEIEKPYSRGST